MFAGELSFQKKYYLCIIDKNNYTKLGSHCSPHKHAGSIKNPPPAEPDIGPLTLGFLKTRMFLGILEQEKIS